MALLTTYTCKKLEPYMNPDDAQVVSIKLANSLTLARGTVLGRISASNLWKAYNDASSDGSEVARAILQYDVATDSSGNHFFGAAASSELGESVLTVPAFVSGVFAVADLTGIDANGLADLQGNLIFGDSLADTANAVIRF